MSHVMRGIFGALIVSGFFTVNLVLAQDYMPVEIRDLKSSPQRYWAKGIVFRDTLKTVPGTRTLRIDDRTITRFETEQIGELYAVGESIDRLRQLTPGMEYLFSGTVAQRGRNYFIVVRDASSIAEKAEKVPEMMGAINLDNPTNEYNRVFASLEQIMKEVQKDIFAYATAQNITVKEMFDHKGEHRDKIFNSIRLNVRKIEEQSKIPAQEYLISLIVAIMAMQQGYTEAAPPVYHPDDSSVTSVVEKIEETSAVPVEEVAEENWDLSASPDPAPVVETVPAAPVEEVAEQLVPVEKDVIILDADDEEPMEQQAADFVMEESAPVEAAAQNSEVDGGVQNSEALVETVELTEADAGTPVEVIEASAESAPEFVSEPETIPVVVEEQAVPVIEFAAETATEPAIEPEPEQPAATDMTVEDVVATVAEIVPLSEPEPVVIETVVPVADFPVETAVEPVVTPSVEQPSAAPDKKAEKKKKKSKKEKSERVDAEPVTPEVSPSEDKIDYSKPLRLR